MATINRSEINGIIDTSKSVLENLNTLATAAGAFLTWDPIQGKWNVIANEEGTSTHSFNDSNIIGAISISGSGINELYNSVTINFPHKDLRDAVDTIELSIDSSDRYPQEVDNVLNLSLTCVNDPVQAQLIATRELKQNRVDKIIQFTTDFNANGLKAGDLIDVTSDEYDFSSKLFRIIQIDEEDDDSGVLGFGITALEYDADVYSTAGLTREYRTERTGVVPEINNEAIATSKDIDIGKQIGGLLAANAALGLINSLFTVDEETGAIINEGKFADEDIQNAVSSISKPSATNGNLTVSKSADDICDGTSVTFTIQSTCESCFFNNPQFTYDYEITGVLDDGIDVPLEGTLTTTGTTATTLVATINHGQSSTQTITFTCGGTSVSVDVHAEPDEYVVEVVATSNTITEGDSVSVTVNTFGYDNGTNLNYTISGSAASKVTSPALTGTVTLSSDTASLNIVTADDSAYNADESLTVVIGTASTNPCVVSSNSTTITVENNDTTGPITPDVPKPGDTTCEYVQVPVIWCGTFDADTQYLKSVSVRKYAYLPVAPTGGTAVPTSLSVTNPGESSAAISIDSTVNIEPGGLGMGGAQIDVITSGFTALGGGDTTITGTISTLNGYW
jgi:hypothetical protein